MTTIFHLAAQQTTFPDGILPRISANGDTAKRTFAPTATDAPNAEPAIATNTRRMTMKFCDRIVTAIGEFMDGPSPEFPEDAEHEEALGILGGILTFLFLVMMVTL